jgi:multidrug efflux pump subunit AcrB
MPEPWPLALAIGQGSGIQQPLAIAIIAGLLLQFPLVLLAMPVLIGFTFGTSEVEARQRLPVNPP